MGLVPGLLAQRMASGYDQTVAHLAELRDLAVHSQAAGGIRRRLREALAPYPSSATLQRRLREQKQAK